MTRNSSKKAWIRCSLVHVPEATDTENVKRILYYLRSDLRPVSLNKIKVCPN